MEDSSSTPTQDAKMDADPEGDLVLVIGSGENQKSIRASSKVLSLASPVLAAMFNPRRFSEGSALSSSNPPDIYLPEDDPEAVIMFCRHIHFREYQGNQKAPSFDQLLNMALLCDKYDAALALNPWCELWLPSQPDFEKDGNHRNMLALAYAFNNQGTYVSELLFPVWLLKKSRRMFREQEHSFTSKSWLTGPFRILNKQG